MGDERLEGEVEEELEEVIVTEGGGIRITSRFSASTVVGGEVRFRIEGPTIDFIDCH